MPLKRDISQLINYLLDLIRYWIFFFQNRKFTKTRTREKFQNHKFGKIETRENYQIYSICLILIIIMYILLMRLDLCVQEGILCIIYIYANFLRIPMIWNAI